MEDFFTPEHYAVLVKHLQRVSSLLEQTANEYQCEETEWFLGYRAAYNDLIGGFVMKEKTDAKPNN